MGYYTTIIAWSLELKDKTMTQEQYEALFKKHFSGDPDSGYWNNLLVDDGLLEFDDCYCKFYEYEKFAAFLKTIVTNDSYVECRGEDSDQWLIVLDGKGVDGWHEKGGRMTYDSEYVDFMSAYKKDMPEQLKVELKKWKMMVDL